MEEILGTNKNREYIFHAGHSHFSARWLLPTNCLNGRATILQWSETSAVTTVAPAQWRETSAVCASHAGIMVVAHSTYAKLVYVNGKHRYRTNCDEQHSTFDTRTIVATSHNEATPHVQQSNAQGKRIDFGTLNAWPEFVGGVWR